MFNLTTEGRLTGGLEKMMVIPMVFICLLGSVMVNSKIAVPPLLVNCLTETYKVKSYSINYVLNIKYR